MVQSQGGTVRPTPDVQRFAHELWDYARCRNLRGLKGASSAGYGQAPQELDARSGNKQFGSPIFPSLTARLESRHYRIAREELGRKVYNVLHALTI